jgi:hypothetical protein
MVVFAVVDDALSPDFPLGNALEVFVHREDAERFIEEVRNDEPELASYLRIEERELDLRQAQTAQRRALADKTEEVESAGKSSV